MKRPIIATVSFASFCLLLAAAGYAFQSGLVMRAKEKRTHKLSAPMAGIEVIAIDTSFGRIAVTGGESGECDVTVHITVQATSAQEANEIADKVVVRLEPQGKTLVVKILKPHLERNRSVAADIIANVPHKTGVKCNTSFGKVALTNLEGEIDAGTSFGEIKLDTVAGNVAVNTSHGDINAKQITSGDFTANTSFGAIRAAFTDSCPPNMSAKLVTSFGEIDADVPGSFAGSIDLATSFGDIDTELPVTLQGKMGKDHMRGTVGEGSGKLLLNTSFGSILLH